MKTFDAEALEENFYFQVNSKSVSGEVLSTFYLNNYVLTILGDKKEGKKSEKFKDTERTFFLCREFILVSSQSVVYLDVIHINFSTFNFSRCFFGVFPAFL